MAESGCNVVSNNIQTDVSVVQRTASNEEPSKTDNKVLAPMLLEDYKSTDEPQTLTNLLQWFKTHTASIDRNDILAGLIYVLMLESEFVPPDHVDPKSNGFNYQKLLKFSEQLPANWKRKDKYCFDFVLSSAPARTVSITGVVVGDDFLVNCVIGELGTLSVVLDSLVYFASNDLMKIQELNHLSKRFKDAIAFPAKCCVVKSCGGSCACLEDLPSEILLEIFKLLKVRDFLNLAETNSFFYQVTQEPAWWARRIYLDFKTRTAVKSYAELRKFYLSEHNKKKKSSRTTRFFPRVIF